MGNTNLAGCNGEKRWNANQDEKHCTCENRVRGDRIEFGDFDGERRPDHFGASQALEQPPEALRLHGDGGGREYERSHAETTVPAHQVSHRHGEGVDPEEVGVADPEEAGSGHTAEGAASAECVEEIERPENEGSHRQDPRDRDGEEECDQRRSCHEGCPGPDLHSQAGTVHCQQQERRKESDREELDSDRLGDDARQPQGAERGGQAVKRTIVPPPRVVLRVLREDGMRVDLAPGARFAEREADVTQTVVDGEVEHPDDDRHDQRECEQSPLVVLRVKVSPRANCRLHGRYDARLAATAALPVSTILSILGSEFGVPACGAGDDQRRSACHFPRSRRRCIDLPACRPTVRLLRDGASCSRRDPPLTNMTGS